MYPMGTVEVCLAVFSTRMELEQQSDTKDEQKPMKAARNRRGLSSSYLGSDSFRVLYCTRGAGRVYTQSQMDCDKIRGEGPRKARAWETSPPWYCVREWLLRTFDPCARIYQSRIRFQLIFKFECTMIPVQWLKTWPAYLHPACIMSSASTREITRNGPHRCTVVVTLACALNSYLTFSHPLVEHLSCPSHINNITSITGHKMRY